MTTLATQGALVDMPLAGWADVLVPTEGVDVPCLNYDPEIFFADRPHDIEVAKQICQPCPRRASCLAGALRRAEPHGVWGGELLVDGQIVARKRPRGRPPKTMTQSLSSRITPKLTKEMGQTGQDAA